MSKATTLVAKFVEPYLELNFKEMGGDTSNFSTKGLLAPLLLAISRCKSSIYIEPTSRKRGLSSPPCEWTDLRIKGRVRELLAENRLVAIHKSIFPHDP